MALSTGRDHYMQKEILTAANRKRGAKIKDKKASAARPVITTEYMTTVEAAAYIKMSRQFLEAARYRGDGSGPAYIKVGRSVRYRKPVLDAWMTAHDHSPDKPIKSR
jgi:hypothetical protein